MNIKDIVCADDRAALGSVHNCLPFWLNRALPWLNPGEAELRLSQLPGHLALLCLC